MSTIWDNFRNMKNHQKRQKISIITISLIHTVLYLAFISSQKKISKRKNTLKNLSFSHQYLVEDFSLRNETGINKVRIFRNQK